MEKTFDCYTKIDDRNRMVGHFCPDGDCGHCKAGVPFAYPPLGFLPQLSERSLLALAAHAERQAIEAASILRSIKAEREARDG